MADNNNKYFDKVRLLDGTYAEVCDSVARQAIAGGTYFMGITTTPLTDGATTNPITIGAESVTAINGAIAIYGNKEFIFAGVDNKWHEFGDITGLGSLALKDSVSATYTPAGTVSKPNVTVTPVTATIHEVDDAGSVTPGTANVPTAVTLPVLTTTLNGTTLELGWSAGSVTPGTAGSPTVVSLPTTKNTSVMTGASAELAAAPVFTGTEATIVSD
jgi:hypothetical protein